MTRDADFRTLGLSSDASWEDVKRAFRRLARIYHPDVAGPAGSGKFVEITEAYMALKDSVFTGFGEPHARGSAVTGAPKAKTAGGESVFRKFWKKIFSREAKKAKSEEDEEITPARARFIGSVISRAESEMEGIISRKDEFVSRERTDAMIRRLRSRHPSVVMLALRQISVYNVKDEIAYAVIDHFRKNVPVSETLERVLDVFSHSPKRDELARVMLHHLPDLSDSDAMAMLTRFKRWKMQAEFFRPFLSHRSPSVVAGALSCWPANGCGDKSELASLLRHDEENILIPLLRALRSEKLPPWAGGRLAKLMREHPSPAVRVWACAIVRDQNLG
jgi:hypothetical protein